MARRRSRRPRLQLVPANCERCGREVYTANRSLFGLDHLKAKWGVLCSSCTTEEEQREMLDDQFQGIMGVRPPRGHVHSVTTCRHDAEGPTILWLCGKGEV